MRRDLPKSVARAVETRRICPPPSSLLPSISISAGASSGEGAGVEVEVVVVVVVVAAAAAEDEGEEEEAGTLIISPCPPKGTIYRMWKGSSKPSLDKRQT
jgi:hypothetical protein